MLISRRKESTIFSKFFSLKKDFDSVGYLYPNGSKTGILKLLDEHVADGTPPIYIYTLERLDHFDYIFPTEIAE